MQHKSAATNSFQAPEWDATMEVHLPSVDADYEWLGYEAVHPLTWVPAAAQASAPAA